MSDPSRWARFRLHDGSIERIDDRLEPTASRRVKVSTDARLLAATEDLSVVIAAENERVVVEVGCRRWEVPIGQADSAEILRDGDLLLTAPIMERSV